MNAADAERIAAARYPEHTTYTAVECEKWSIVQRVFRTFILESVAFDLVLKRLPPALRG